MQVVKKYKQKQKALQENPPQQQQQQQNTLGFNNITNANATLDAIAAYHRKQYFYNIREQRTCISTITTTAKAVYYY